MKTIVNLAVCAAVVLVGITVSGCSTTAGGIRLQSHFAYPNSNVTPLGQVQVVKSKGNFLVPWTAKKDDVTGLLKEALAQKPGADLLVDCTLDTKLTMMPIIPYYTTTVTLKGTAAKMEVGEQDLQVNLDQMKY